MPETPHAHHPRTSRPRRARRPRRRRVWVGGVLLLTLLVGVCTSLVLPPQDDLERAALEPVPSAVPPSRERALDLLGTPRSGGRWHSGVWAGGDVASGERVEAFGKWRGTRVDAVTMYPAYRTWEEIAGSTWHIDTFDSTPAVLVYGLPMLPSQDEGSFRSVVAGEHDRVYRKVAQDLLDRGRGTSVVRIGWEANGAWFPWNATAQDAVEYRAAFRHVVRVLWSVAPDLVIDFDVACGTTLRGQDSRTDTLELLYPGDDVVDVVGCDTFDWYHTVTVDDASWAATQRPADAVGIADVADFARAHGKGMTVPEWGLASPQEQGRGDNPLLMQRMRGFFEDNADVLVLESYFNEPDTSLANSIWDPVQHPRASQVYADLW